METAIIVTISLGLGILLTWLLARMHFLRRQQALESDLKLLSAQKQDAFSQAEKLETVIKSSLVQITELEKKKTELETRLAEQTNKFKEQIELLNSAKEQMKQDFEILAQRIFEEKGNKFREQSKEQLNLLLNPFREQMADFRKKVEEVYDKEGQQRFSLAEEIKKMHSAYESLSQEANNLVRALKSDTKTQGDWGEINLKRILDFTGLKEGLHYFSQPNFKTETGENLRPDIVVNLPDDRQIIVDSKVSLTGYERYYSAVEDSEKESGVKEHLKSIRRHVAELSEKKYEDLKGINTLDFVLMFIPVEAAYFVAINNDSELYKFASEKKVLLVCPSTLLITMQLVGSLWRIDDQKRHVNEIAEQGAKLYEKFVGFVSSMTEIKKHLDKSQEAYQKAHSQLSEGRGNLVSQAGKLIKLGVKAKSRLPEQFILEADEIDEVQELENQSEETEPDFPEDTNQ